MTLKMTFLGSGTAFATSPENYNSNILLQLNSDSLLLDAGSDLKHSLHDLGFSFMDIKNIYISHLHGDHTGGLEWLALKTYFNPEYPNKPNLYAAKALIRDLWNKSLRGGLSTLTEAPASIESFFNIYPIKNNDSFNWNSIAFKLIKTIHFHSNYKLMPSYGLIFNYNNTCILFTADTQFTPDRLLPFYERADIIFHDCEISATKSTVHAHYSELNGLPIDIKKKMWLYHYDRGDLPDAKKDGFLGFVTKGQHFIF